MKIEYSSYEATHEKRTLTCEEVVTANLGFDRVIILARSLPLA